MNTTYDRQPTELTVPSIFIPDDIEKEYIITLIDRFIIAGIRFIDDINKRKSGKRTFNELSSIVGKKTISDLPADWKKGLRSLGRSWVNNSNIQFQRQLEEKTDEWLDLVKKLIHHPDIRLFFPKRTITSWNTSLAKARQKVKIETRINHSLRLLDRMKQEFYSTEQIGFRSEYEETIYIDIKKDNPDIHEILIASKLLMMNGISSNDYATCLANCRRILEAFSVKNGFGNFKEFVKSLQIGKSKKKLLKENYNFLSGYGSHHKDGGITRAEMEFGYYQTLSSISIINKK